MDFIVKKFAVIVLDVTQLQERKQRSYSVLDHLTLCVCLTGKSLLILGPVLPQGNKYKIKPPDKVLFLIEATSFIRLFDFQPIHMSEMYAYSMATVHHSIQHIVLHDLMVSNVKVESEGWHLIDKIDQMCLPPSKIRNDNGGQQTSLFYTEQRLPTFVHYCQIYALDSNIKWSKYEMKSNDNFQCNHEKEVGIKLQSLRIVDDLQSKTKTKFVDQEENFYNGSIKSLKLRNNSSTVITSSFLPSGGISSSTVIRRNAFIICIMQACNAILSKNSLYYIIVKYSATQLKILPTIILLYLTVSNIFS